MARTAKKRTLSARQKAYAEHLAAGLDQNAAYAAAGYGPDRANAAKLARNPLVVELVAEIRGKAVTKAVVSLDSMTMQLFEDRSFARSLGNPGAAVRATVALCQIHGLLKNVHDHTGQMTVVNKLSDMDAVRRIAFAFALAERQEQQKTIEGHVDAPDVG
jgi:hypothetical protein